MPPRLGALLAVLFWGVSFVATKAVVREISPITLIFTRAGLGTALLVAILALRRQNALPPRDALLPLAAMGFVVLASTVNWALYTVLGHATIRRLGPTRATAGAMLLGWLMLLPPFAARAGWNDYARLSPAGWLAVLFLGVACSGLGYLFWYGALERVEASRVAALLYLEPLVTLAAAVVLLGEPVRPTTVLGGLMVVGGVVLVQAARGTGRPGGAADRA